MIIGNQAALSGIHTSIRRTDIAAHDIANVNTANFQQSIPYQVSAAPTGTGLGHVAQQPNAQELSNTELATEAVEMKTGKHSLAANAAVIKATDKMLDDLVDLVR